jgi:hypothetical protein
VEYKLFGTALEPPTDFKDDLAAFCRLDDEQRSTIAEWFLSADDYDLYAPNLPASIVKSTLMPEQFRQTAGVIRTLVSHWHRRGLELRDVERDLLLLGCDPAQINIISTTLDRLSPIKDRVWIDARKDAERTTGLPTIDNAYIVWNARPVFNGDAYYFFDADSFEASYDRLLGLVYLATMEMSLSDSNGNKQRISIQMDERTFGCLLDGMNRAANQLKVFKASTKEPRPSSNGPEGDN